ncbi:hypothetical protein PT974_08236 [Cladobotryum mycophilum]|uniref:Uncharacterized protein n=1 Tax=Cladobotryum mycophilum TaxID=491253 RepID=A0ABR0SCU0_9HYPO
MTILFPLIIDQVERLRDTDPEARELISSLVGDAINDPYIISQFLQQFELYQPWSRSLKHCMEERQNVIEKSWVRVTEPWDMMLSVNAESHHPLSNLGNPSKKRFYYPSDKIRTRENRTPNWIEEPGVISTEQQERHEALHQPVGDIYKPLSTLYFGQPSQMELARRRIRPPGASEEENKGASQGSTDGDPAIDAIVAKSAPKYDPPPSICVVDTRALKVFRTLFFNAAVTSTPGEISWNDFLHAMTSTGFAAEKRYGSVWQFQMLGEAGQVRIQFHEPHPMGKIPFFMARRHGRRLNRALRWAGTTFVLKEKRVSRDADETCSPTHLALGSLIM